MKPQPCFDRKQRQLEAYARFHGKMWGIKHTANWLLRKGYLEGRVKLAVETLRSELKAIDKMFVH